MDTDVHKNTVVECANSRIKINYTQLFDLNLKFRIVVSRG